MLRVIAGQLGGRRFRTPSGARTRPTADRVREALFNILGPPPADARVLDLYAGSGALGIEALSRGAEQALFVDEAADACRLIGENLRDLGVSAQARVLCRRVRTAMPALRAYGPFAWVFADPPYASTELPDVLTALWRHELLLPTAQIVVERAARDADALCAQLAEGPLSTQFSLLDRRRYGDSALLFLTPTSASSDVPSASLAASTLAAPFGDQS